MTSGLGVVVPVYRGRRWIAETLASVLDQDLQPDVVLVVDDGCPDHTGELVEGLGLQRVQVHRTGNGGVGAARAAGLDALPPSIMEVMFLDQDDVLMQGRWVGYTERCTQGRCLPPSAIQSSSTRRVSQ